MISVTTGVLLAAFLPITIFFIIGIMVIGFEKWSNHGKN